MARSKQQKPKLPPLTPAELIANGDEALRDAFILHRNGAHNNAHYLGGYAAEFWMKARIAQNCGWALFPPEDYEDKLTP